MTKSHSPLTKSSSSGSKAPLYSDIGILRGESSPLNKILECSSIELWRFRSIIRTTSVVFAYHHRHAASFHNAITLASLLHHQLCHDATRADACSLVTTSDVSNTETGNATTTDGSCIQKVQCTLNIIRCCWDDWRPSDQPAWPEASVHETPHRRT